MELPLSPLPPFLALPGEPPIPWPRWLESFEIFIEAIGLAGASDARRRAMLIHSLGGEGQRIFRTLGPATTFTDCIALLSGHFAAPQSVMVRRIIFRQRRQRPGESVHHYVADLRGLASVCRFGDLEDEMIRDQLAEHTTDLKLREKLFLSPDDTSLSRAVEMAFQLESAALLASQLAASGPAPALPHLAPHLSPSHTVALAAPLPDTAAPLDELEVNVAGRRGATTGQHCGNCGSSSHRTRAPTCPALGQRCQRCGKMNHFSRVCRSAPAPANPGPRPPNASGSTTIHSVGAITRPFKWCTVELDGVCLSLLLDTAASKSLLNESTVRRLFPRMTVKPGTEDLFGYGHTKIDMVGTATFSVRYGARTLPAFTFQVSRKGANLLGFDLFCALGFSITDNLGATILTVATPWLHRWPSLFTGLGCLTAFNHQPLLNPEVTPVIQPLRRLPLALRDDVSAELQKLLDAGVIERVDASPWISNLVVARKKTGGLRPCIDLRQVNKAVIPDKYPLPTSEELSAKFHGSSVFSKLDLRQGYLQVPLHPESRNLTAFVSHMGVFRYTRMPFGLSSAPSCFQKIMTTIFAGIPGVVVYLDDIVVHGATAASHDDRLSRVLEVLTRHNLTLNGEKCIFSAPVIEFVGFRLNADGLSPLHSNVEAILSLPEPSCPAQLSSFLGMTAFYLRFLPHYSETTAPLRALLKQDAPWSWTPTCSAAVRLLKTQLTSPPVLAHFDLRSPTLVTCDASNTAIGAVLSQLHGGTERPVAFASRSLTPTEQRYSVGEREALACVWACERWHMYLYGRHFTLRTDHQALTALLATTGSGHKPLRLYRWSERLQAYNFTTVFTPGRDNVVADLLSRATPSSPPDIAPDGSESELILMLHEPLQTTVSLQELQAASAQDPVLVQLRTFIREGWPAKVPEELAPFHRVRDDLSCWNDDCVARGLCTVIPSSLRQRILNMAHDGHLGIVRVKQRCRSLVWWPGIDRDIETMVKDCTACLISGKTGPPPTPPLQPLQWPATPWSHIQVDICGEFHGTPHHQRFLLVAYDLHSKWPEVLPVSSVTTQQITDFLSSLFARWGVPDAVTTDNGPQFISADFAAFTGEKGIKHIRTALYHPQANGGVERFNQTLKNGLRAHLAEGLPFSTALQNTVLHYRATPHATTGSSPAFLMLGRELQLPMDRLRPPKRDSPGPPAAGTSVGDKVAENQRRMKHRYDMARRILAQLGPATFRLADGSRWHASRLRRVNPPSAQELAAAADPRHTAGDWDFPPVAPGIPPEPEAPGDALGPRPRPIRARRKPPYLRDYVLHSRLG
ncbi:uncharacterized protein K02A2.6-like [Corythoichthys intestinalis]|uniref:uncharacterized protein K02A2.6-like n=1 Tax=Corythoichthys intestinalis TaxID=161448 RepID=UPI0025A5FB00|nr:uncharacterized protein K02A2.6-like [Corythoichthys intestinalis]